MRTAHRGAADPPCVLRRPASVFDCRSGRPDHRRGTESRPFRRTVCPVLLCSCAPVLLCPASCLYNVPMLRRLRLRPVSVLFVALFASCAIVRAIEDAGFEPRDVRLLLNTQAHYDHVGTLAHLKQATGGRVLVMKGD